MADIQEKAAGSLSQLVDHAKDVNYKGVVTAWKSDLNGVLSKVRLLPAVTTAISEECHIIGFSLM